MTTTTTTAPGTPPPGTPPPGGQPFEDRNARLLWEAGIPLSEQDFETEAEAIAAAEAVLKMYPDLTFTVTP
jgi:hypothetical protein